MKKKKIIEAWRDEDYYLSLSDDERAALPEHPSGITGVADSAIRSVTGGCASLTTEGGYSFCGGSAACSACGPYWCN